MTPLATLPARVLSRLGLGWEDSSLCWDRRRELSSPPRFEPSAAPSRTASYREPGVGASSAPTTRKGVCCGG